ncbi:hypothetical protein HY620_00820 [Candidatus Uhrbacteria bacterium]|nr:hypothetical protein [Candidatus Uhrbacteria bacterium]
MPQPCIQCKKDLSFDQKDQEFIASFGAPLPKRCHPCRRTAQLIWENELLLYPRKCDRSGKSILSMYPENVPFPVYDTKEWWSDTWDGKDYGRDIDFSRPFFEQWYELEKSVPHQARFVIEGNIVNSDFINYCSNVKNCYLTFDSDYNDNCYYSYTLQNDKDVVDCLKVRESELCYECIDCFKCYKCRYCQNVQNSNECVFGYNLSNCTNCFGCVNMKNAQYCWFNEQLSKEDYEKKLSQSNLTSRKSIQAWGSKFEEHKKNFPKQYMHGVNNIDCTGDYLMNSKSAIECYDGFRVEDSKYCEALFLPIKDCYECFECGEDSSRMYYSAVCGFQSYNLRFCWGVMEGCSDCDYSLNCRSIKNCFGCSNLRSSQYCILNKQYSKEEYERLHAQLIEHMKATGEWGEYFPPEYSPFAYNASNAILFSPESKETTIALGYRWDDSADTKRGTPTDIPDNLSDADEAILANVFADKDTGQQYKIIKQELEFYKKLGIPLPDKSFLERHKTRMAKRNPKKLYERMCVCANAAHNDHHESPENCKRPFQTTWNPSREKNIYCRECFAQEMV